LSASRPVAVKSFLEVEHIRGKFLFGLGGLDNRRVERGAILADPIDFLLQFLTAFRRYRMFAQDAAQLFGVLFEADRQIVGNVFLRKRLCARKERDQQGCKGKGKAHRASFRRIVGGVGRSLSELACNETGYRGKNMSGVVCQSRW
jgi:hypothetical protein